MKNDRCRAIFCCLALCVFLLPSLPFAQDASRNSWLSRVVVKFEKMRDDAASDIARYEKKISQCEATISQSEAIVTLAEKKGNVKAEQIARESSVKAQEARKKNEANKSAMEALKARAAEALTNVQNVLATLSSADAKIQAVVSNYSGRVMYISKRLKEPIRLGARGSGGLETGDEITTDTNSRARLQCLDGRGSVDLGENTKLKVEQSDSGSQVMGLVKGKINVAVEKMEDFAGNVGKELDSELIKGIRKVRAHVQKFIKNRFEVHTPAGVAAVRGTRFTVSEDSSKGTEMIVLDGTVEVQGVHDDGQHASVEAGYRIKVSKDGTISEPEKIDMAGVERWWEK